jgi:hypothetical protein
LVRRLLRRAGLSVKEERQQSLPYRPIECAGHDRRGFSAIGNLTTNEAAMFFADRAGYGYKYALNQPALRHLRAARRREHD